MKHKTSKYLDVVKASGIDQISARFLKDGAAVVAIHVTNILNLLIELRKIAKMNLYYVCDSKMYWNFLFSPLTFFRIHSKFSDFRLQYLF